MKKYLSELLIEELAKWTNQMIAIVSTTGSGKTVFVVDNLIKHYLKKETLTKRKVLILCNRKLLRRQYWFQIIRRYDRYAEITSSVEIRTYQELAMELRSRSSVDGLFADYCAIVCDEFHYFYADADFNAIGTYPLLNAIIRAGANLPMIFLSATAEETLPLLKKTLIEQKSLAKNELIRNVNPRCPDWNKVSDFERQMDCFSLMKYEFPELCNYDRFKCFAVSDEETLCQTIVGSKGKSVVFIDDRKQADRIAERLKQCGVKGNDIALINADNIDAEEMRYVIDPLVMTNKVRVRVLLTTSVLDNGVSIHDPKVDTVVIITDSKISFMQMLGRVRADENVSEIRLIFLIRSPEVFRIRAERYGRILEVANDVRCYPEHYTALSIIEEYWNCRETELQSIYRSIFVPMHPDCSFLPDDRVRTVSSDGLAIQIRGKEIGFFLNRYALEKIGNSYITEQRFYQDALTDPIKVIETQMSWINKAPQELVIFESVMKAEYLEELLKIKDYTLEEFKEAIATIIKKYKCYFFADIDTKNSTMENDKFQAIVEREGMKFIKVMEKDRRNRYSVISEKEEI